MVEALSQYSTTGRPRGIVMGYGAADPASITPGLARLAGVLGATPSTPARPPR